MNKKEKLAFAIVAALAMTSGGFAMGQSVNNLSSDQVIYACVTGVNGNITKVSNTPKTCPRGTTPISWNMVGPKGDKGDQGVSGPQGIQGIKGDSVTVTEPNNKVGMSLVSPDGVSYEVISWLGVTLVEVDGFYWLYHGRNTYALYMNYGFYPLELYSSANCEGQGYFASRQQYPIPSKIAYNSPVEEAIRSEFATLSTSGFSLTPSAIQDEDTFLSIMTVDYRADGTPASICENQSNGGITTRLTEMEYNFQNAYLYKATPLGLSQAILPEEGWRFEFN